ncbi:hypothetical protein [uncultured Cohaesibacter sp.]|uniref:hypothetical protein n=1 Tax=uncultured Cohaesibacter sp. TaxID=1002546 RepID=UPI0029C919CD|nr:hypothetical protein [uncultured Cohaesibacter sp.]
MRQIARHILVACLAFIAIQSSGNHSVQAGILSSIIRGGEHVASGAAKKIDHLIPSLEEAGRLARHLPGADDAARVALVPAEGGSWRLVGVEGEAHTLSKLDDLAGSLEAHFDDVPKRAAIAVREEDFFKLREDLTSRPNGADLHLVRNRAQILPLVVKSDGGKPRLMVVLGPKMLLDPSSVRALDANIDLMRRGLNRSDLKMARFDSQSASAQASAQAADPIASLAPDALDISLSRYKNKTLVLTGKIEAEAASNQRWLVVQDGKEARRISLDALEKSADVQRVNLMIVQSSTPRQPGTGWFNKSGFEKRFADAQSAMTQRDLFEALTPPDAMAVIRSSREGGHRVVLSANFDTPRSAATSESGGFAKLARATGEGLLEVPFRIGVHSIRINAEEPRHTDEVNGRWIPWVSNGDLIAIAIVLVVSLIVSLVTWHWWAGIWGLFGVGPDSGAVVKSIRGLTFLPFAVLVLVPGLVWLIMRDWIMLVTWPFRKLYHSIRS